MDAYIVLALSTLLITDCCYCQRVSDQIYVNLDDNVHCFRLLNGTHQIGCQSKESGNTGVMYVVENENDIKFIENDPGSYGDFVAVLSLEKFTDIEMVHKLKSLDQIVGIIVYWDENSEKPTPFSPDYSCPNSVAARFCDALGDYNVISFVPPSIKSKPFQNGSVMMIVSRMDSFSMFTNMSPGAESALTSVIAVLAVAEAVGRIRAQLEETAKRNDRFLMFSFLHGESLHYIGSDRMIYDMKTKNFPFALDEKNEKQSSLLNLENIGFFLELNQIGLPTDKKNYFAHIDPEVYREKQKEIDDILKNLQTFQGLFPISKVDNLPVPPSSYKRYVNNSTNYKIPGIVLTDYKEKFQNKYYNSFLDRNFQFEPKTVDAIGNLSDSVLKSAVKWIGFDETAAKIDRSVVANLYNCFIAEKNWANCDMFSRILSTKNINVDVIREENWLRTYIQVSPRFRALSLVRLYVDELMSWYLGEKTNNTNTIEECQKLNDHTQIFTFNWIKDLSGETHGNFCINSTVRKTPAESPAFQIDGYDWSSGQFSTWTESIWAGASFRLFLVPPPGYEVGVFFGGLGVLVLSCLVVWFLARKSELLFEKPKPTHHHHHHLQQQ